MADPAETPPGDGLPEIPDELPVLPLKDAVVFPEAVAPLAIGEERSIRLIEDVLNRPDRLVVLVASREPELAEPGPGALYDVGTVAYVQKMLRVPDGTLRILVNGLVRVVLGPYAQTTPFLVAKVRVIPDVDGRAAQVEALGRNLQAIFSRIIDLVPYLPDELQVAAANVEDPGTLSYLVASALRLSTAERQELLAEPNLEARLRRLTVICNREMEVLELGQKIQSEVQEDMDKTQREYFLRQQLKAIQQELGETDETQAEINELRARLGELTLPEEIAVAANRELDRLSRLPSAAAEYSVVRTYLEWILSLPWGTTTDDNLDLKNARKVLDEDHYNIETVKERILEHLAVARLKKDAAGPILCFVGPPGVGKTSLGQSIARALGRKFARFSVGGVRDESEIRGHRRTYIGALPGTPVRSLRDAGSMNPVILIDEIDKMGSDVRGDPSSAMLEVLDPAQNSTFRDHYLDLPLDLSRVLFICTANMLETIPRPLLDRMEIIQLSGYTEEEKLHIARRYLLPRQLAANGLTPSQLRITDKGLRTIISEYTREAGVRNLERRIGAVARKAAVQIAKGSTRGVNVSAATARELLGPERLTPEAKRRTREPGVATGLAVTGAGGEVLFVEAQAMPGSGRLTVTGQVGDVMRESALAAMSYVRAHQEDLGLKLADDYFQTHDIHLHVPAGAVPKDGPSAGVTMTTALVSALTGRPASGDVAMTGEITLTGQVLPIGGVKEKVLAARRAGIRTVVIPAQNAPQLQQVPKDLLDDMTVVLADQLGDVLDAALGKGRGRR
jgi:ATP-dependent Lon protease